MRLARIRTNDPEAAEYLSAQLAASGYQLEFVKEDEIVVGDADLEISASRMEVEHALAVARRQAEELGCDITVLPGTFPVEEVGSATEEVQQISSGPAALEAEQVELFPQEPELEMPRFIAKGSNDHLNAEVSPYARGAEFDDEPSRTGALLNKTADAIAGGVQSLVKTSSKLAQSAGDWSRSRFDEFRRRQEESRRERAIMMERLRQQEAQRKQADAARLEAQRARENEERSAMQEAELLRRQNEALRLREREEHLAREREQQLARQRAEQLAREHEAQVFAEQQTVKSEQVLEPAPDKSQPIVWDSPVVPPPPIFQTNSTPDILFTSSKPHSHSSTQRFRERTFRRAGLAAAAVAGILVAVFGVASIRQPAQPLSNSILERSSQVEQSVPFGPAKTVAPITQPNPLRVVKGRKAVQKAPAKTKRTAKKKTRQSAVEAKAKKKPRPSAEQEVVVRHFNRSHTEQAKAKSENGVKIISDLE